MNTGSKSVTSGSAKRWTVIFALPFNPLDIEANVDRHARGDGPFKPRRVHEVRSAQPRNLVRFAALIRPTSRRTPSREQVSDCRNIPIGSFVKLGQFRYNIPIPAPKCML